MMKYWPLAPESRRPEHWNMYDYTVHESRYPAPATVKAHWSSGCQHTHITHTMTNALNNVLCDHTTTRILQHIIRHIIWPKTLYPVNHEMPSLNFKQQSKTSIKYSLQNHTYLHTSMWSYEVNIVTVRHLQINT